MEKRRTVRTSDTPLEESEARLKAMPSYMMAQRKLLELQIRNKRAEIREKSGAPTAQKEWPPVPKPPIIPEQKQESRNASAESSGPHAPPTHKEWITLPQ